MAALVKRDYRDTTIVRIEEGGKKTEDRYKKKVRKEKHSTRVVK